jgi:transcriptional regulator with XRE-family HTH domain
MKNLKKKLKQALLDANLTQTQLAKNLGITRQQVNAWINDSRRPTDLSLKKIAEATKKDLNFFLNENYNEGIAGVIGNNTGGVTQNIEAADKTKALNKKTQRLEKENIYLKGQIAILEKLLAEKNKK